MNAGNRPEFSVVVPVHNKAPHVRRSIASILDQTLADFEILVVDDASSDNSLEEIESFVDERIRVFHRDQPGPGGYAARNLGIRHARGEWVAFLDADDEWCPEHLNNLHELAREFPECDFLTCGWKRVEAGGRSSMDDYFDSYQIRGSHQLSLLDYLAACVRNKRPTHTCVACIRNNGAARDLFPEGRAFRGGDLHAWILYLARCKAMAWSPTVGALYHEDAVNMVTRSAPFTPDLPRQIITDIQPLVTRQEMRMLKKYSNRRLFNAWRGQSQDRNRAFRLAPNLFWSGDILFCLTRSIWSILPIGVARQIIRLKRALVGT